MANIQDFYAKSDFPITLIGGVGRSGTTVLRRLLGKDSEICSVQEWRLPVDPGGLVDFYTGVTEVWTPLIFDRRYRELEKLINRTGSKSQFIKTYRSLLHKLMPTNWPQRNLDLPYGAVDATTFCPTYKELTSQLLSELGQFKYKSFWTGSDWMSRGELIYANPPDKLRLAALLGAFFRAVVSESVAASGGRFYLDKNTWYPLLFDKFHELVPEARLIVIHRDPRDVICSLVEQRWAPADLVQAGQYYQGIMDRWYAVKKRLPADCFLEVAYEDLVTSPVEILGNICQFSGLPMPVAPYGLNGESIGRWKKQLNNQQLELIAPYIGSEISELRAVV